MHKCIHKTELEKFDTEWSTLRKPQEKTYIQNFTIQECNFYTVVKTWHET